MAATSIIFVGSVSSSERIRPCPSRPEPARKKAPRRQIDSDILSQVLRAGKVVDSALLARPIRDIPNS
jgi:hypothetical protein